MHLTVVAVVGALCVGGTVGLFWEWFDAKTREQKQIAEQGRHAGDSQRDQRERPSKTA
jgi:hypothetical protein